MNAHSRSGELCLPPDIQTSLPTDRRARILDAAERCFARTGFHRSTMQDVAAECGMSPGNLYRYFPSKEAIVVGLADRDRAEVATDFRQLQGSEDPLGGLEVIARKHLMDMPRQRAALILEIWAEATRNATVAASCRQMEEEIVAMLAGFIARARVGHAGPDAAPAETITTLLIAIGDGIIRRRATDPAFDPGPVFDLMMTMVADTVLPGRPGGVSVPEVVMNLGTVR
jgi:AcrR family transcriptional regulator